MFLNIFIILSWLSFLLIFSFFACYFVILAHFNKNYRSKRNTSGTIYPTISIIVPIHNEEKVIARKIQNIEEITYPNDKVEVIFVDGQSTDRTTQIIEDQLIRCKKSIRLIKQEKRNGYTNAVIEGILSSQGEIIMAMDAASYHYPDAMKHLVEHFVNSKIGAVTGKEVVLGNDKQIGTQ